MAAVIREVWADNLHEEMNLLRHAIERYPYVAMDTEFPGVVARPIGTFRNHADYHYQTLRCNVDLLRIIQLGITLADHSGQLAKEVCTWQFNFKFNLTYHSLSLWPVTCSDDMYAQDSIDLLARSGIHFKKHEEKGIDVTEFGEVMISSGLVLLDDVKWISFHSGYDFGYLLKLLTCKALPTDETEFFKLLHTYFPCLYDIKYLMKSCMGLKGGLQDVADSLGVQRIGQQHQAGSDSLLTALTFFKMRSSFFDDQIDDSKYLGHLYGLGTPAASGSSYVSEGPSGNHASIVSTATANDIAASTIARLEK